MNTSKDANAETRDNENKLKVWEQHKLEKITKHYEKD